MLAAIAIQATGPQPRHHDLIQVCILPLDSSVKPYKGIVPFYVEMLPKRPDNIDYKEINIPKLDFFKLMQNAHPADRMADLFDEWYAKLQLKPGKKLIPVCYQWGPLYSFLEDWLGYKHLEHYFSNEVRDVSTICMYENDRADNQIEQVPYPKHESLSNLCWRHNINNKRSTDPMNDCAALAELYKRLLSIGHLTPIGSYIEVPETPEEK